MKIINYTFPKYLALFGCLILLPSFSAYFNQDEINADEVMKKVQNTILNYKDYKVEEVMTLIRKNGKSYTRKMVSFNKEVNKKEDYSLIIFNTPKDVKGTKTLIHSYLAKNDNQWIYFPSINATKRIANENKSGSFMGSEFANEDLGTMNLFKCRFEYLDSKKYENVECYVIRSYPKNKYSGYTYIDLYISKDNYLPIFQEMYNKKEKHYKDVRLKWKKFNNEFWVIENINVDNLINKRKTTLERFNFQFDDTYPVSFFDSENISNVE